MRFKISMLKAIGNQELDIIWCWLQADTRMFLIIQLTKYIKMEANTMHIRLVVMVLVIDINKLEKTG